ncbi:hypothetical protein H1C71_020941, partial [Ictidomys tridecemlineatus]
GQKAESGRDSGVEDRRQSRARERQKRPALPISTSGLSSVGAGLNTLLPARLKIVLTCCRFSTVSFSRCRRSREKLLSAWFLGWRLGEKSYCHFGFGRQLPPVPTAATQCYWKWRS